MMFYLNNLFSFGKRQWKIPLVLLLVPALWAGSSTFASRVSPFCKTALAEEETPETDTGEKNSSDTDSDSLGITASSAVLIEGSSGRILYEKEKDTELVPASITKIMTLLLIMEALDSGSISLTDEVTVSEYAAGMGGSQVYLEPSETQTVDTMIKCISIASANDAAVAMAEYISGSEAEFVARMNQRAAELGMEHTHFLNCNGLDDSIESGHYSSAYDVALMSRELIMNHPDITKYTTTWMDTITHTTKKGTSEFGLTNTNKLLRIYNGITGLKTGSTSKAKYCLSATSTRDGLTMIAVVMAAPDHKVRFTQAASLMDYGYANCTLYTDDAGDTDIGKIPISGATIENISGILDNTFSYPCTAKENKEDITKKMNLPKAVKAPVKKGDTIGSVTYYLGKNEIGSIDIKASQSVKKASYLDFLLSVACRFFGLVR